MQENVVTYNKSIINSIPVRTLICINLAIIAIMDSYIMWNQYPLGKVITYGFKFLNLLSLLLLIEKSTIKKYLFAIALLPIGWILWDEQSIFKSLQYFYSATLPLIAFILLKPEEQVFTAKFFIRFLFVIYLIGLVIYPLINIISVPHLNFTRSHDGRTYYNYFLLYYTNGESKYIIRRFCSIFDEPGVVGGFNAIILLYYRKVLTRFQYFVFLITGILSISLFFIVIALPILYFSNFRLYNIRKKYIMILGFMLFMVAAYIGLVKYALTTQSDPTMRAFIYERFDWDGDMITGIVNNRDIMAGFESKYLRFQKRGGVDYWFGNGKDATMKELGVSGLSYRIFIYEKGILILIYLALLYFIIHPWRKQFFFSLFSIAFLIAFFYQRPLLYTVNFFLLIYVGLMIKNREEWNGIGNIIVNKRYPNQNMENHVQ